MIIENAQVEQLFKSVPELVFVNAEFAFELTDRKTTFYITVEQVFHREDAFFILQC